MASYNVEFFKNTGLTPGNCMDSITKFRSLFVGFNVDAIWTLQDKFIGRIRVATTYESIKAVDYCIINNTGYWVTGIAMLNENVCEISLQQDFITTIGINNIQVISGFCKRRHVVNDTPFTNTIAEPFTPTQPLELEYGKVVGAEYNSQSCRIILATVDLSEIGNTAKTYEDEVGELKVTVPQLPIPAQGTIFTMSDGSELGRSYVYPIGTAFNGNSTNIRNNISAIRSLGVESAIIDSYAIPASYLESVPTDDIFSFLQGIWQVTNSAINPEYGTAKNKKAYLGTYNRYMIISMATGERQEYEVENIIEPSYNSVVWVVQSDPMPDGSPLIKPSYYHGVRNEKFFGSVSGAKWQKVPIVYRETSGNLIARSQYNRESNISNLGTAIGTITGVEAIPKAIMDTQSAQSKADYNQWARNRGISEIQQYSDIGGTSIGALSQIVGGVGKTVTGVLGVRNSAINFQTQQNIVVPDIQYSPVPGIQNYFGNNFYEVRYHLSSNDLKRFDDFLSEYGYAVDEPLTNDCFIGRQNHNFILAENVNVNVTYGYGSLIERNGIIGLLESGVRIWHTVPSKSALLNNPIV